MNTATIGLQHNAQHRIDQATGAWTVTGKGSKRTHTSYSGWTIRPAVNQQGRWTITRPDGTPFEVFPGSRNQSVHNLAHAKFLADEAGTQNID